MNSRTVGLLALAALVVIDVVLVALALRPGPAITASASSVPLTASAEPTAEATPSPSTSESPSTEPATVTDPEPALLIQRAIDGSLLMTSPGECGGEAAAGYRTAVGTAEWQPWGLPNSVMQRLGSTGQSALFAVASGSDCNESQFYPAQDGASSWGNGLPPEFTYYLVPSTPARVATIFEGEITSPCGETTIALAATDTTPALLCGDGRVLISLDDGANWQERGSISGGRALTFGSPTLLYAAGTADDCNGLTVSSAGSEEGAAWSTVGCIDGANPSGAIGLTAEGSSVTVVDAVSSVFTSNDGGKTFRPGV